MQGLSWGFIQGTTSNGHNKSLNRFSPKHLPAFLLLRHITARATVRAAQGEELGELLEEQDLTRASTLTTHPRELPRRVSTSRFPRWENGEKGK